MSGVAGGNSGSILVLVCFHTLYTSVSTHSKWLLDVSTFGKKDVSTCSGILCGHKQSIILGGNMFPHIVLTYGFSHCYLDGSF